jgi:hypothetical protein
LRSLIAPAPPAPRLGQRRRCRGRRIDDGDAGAGKVGDERAKERIVRAAQQQRVDGGAGWPREDRLAVRIPLPEQRREGVGHGADRDVPVELAGFHERNERRCGVLVDLDDRVLVLDRGEVRVGPDRGGGGDDADPPVPCGERGRRGAGPDHAQHG